MAVFAESRLESLLVTYSFEDHDDYGLRAIVPRALPLEPPFSPSTFAYKIQVPAEVEEIEFEAPHPVESLLEISGNTDLQFGNNVVMLTVTSLASGERISYKVIVERRKERGLLGKIAVCGAIASATLIGTIFLARRMLQPPPSTPVKIEKEAGESTPAARSWKQKLVTFLEEVTVPLF